ncbi:fungal-specific transcription factor domain-domain-containing protein [Microdochium bolleyi]|uniref:Fungal-specific transcription factor domain-domain-containing protein n=1 Tax=Microdochium bolleyi TaxID=196109 RepID=A0A136J9E2_9PEZI|nr:fungal-specific transcription factor domain-domain-containing protein [Microdochium bolleyi]
MTPSYLSHATEPAAPGRQSQPCDACRRAKTRCIKNPGGDATAACVHCSLRGTACAYRHGPPARASQPARDRSFPPPDTPSDSRPSLSSHSGSGDVTAQLPREALPDTQARQADSAVHGGPPQLEAMPHRFAELHGLTSDVEPLLMRHRPFDMDSHECHLGTHGIRRVLHRYQDQDFPLTFHVVADVRAVDHPEPEPELAAIEALVSPWGPKLLELFWRYVHPSYPIIHRDDLMEAYKDRKAPCALLGAIYLVATRWWQYDPDLSAQRMLDLETLRKHVHQAIQSCYHLPKLYSLQALLLTLQCQPDDPLNPDYTFNWGLTCQALAIGQCLGLHLDASQWSIPRPERNARKRLAWALYMQDRWTAAANGCPVHIHDDDWAVADLTDVDFVDCDTADVSDAEEDRRTMAMLGKDHFMLMTRLTQILSDVLANFYTLKKSSEQDTAILLRRAFPMLEALNQWSMTVPDRLGMHIAYERRLSFHGDLHLSYYGVAMTLLRRLIRSTALSPVCSDLAVLSDIRQRALQTAQGAIRLVSQLRSDHLEGFWVSTTPYLFSLIGSFLTLLLVTALSTQERSFWQEALNSYLWKLRTMSKACEPMQYATSRLEGVILRGLEHALAVDIVEPADDTVSPQLDDLSSAVMQYVDFGDWNLFATGACEFGMPRATGDVQQMNYVPDSSMMEVSIPENTDPTTSNL